MKLVPKKNGDGYISSFTLSFGSKEALILLYSHNFLRN